MSHAEEIIRKYAAAQEPIAEFGPWLVADRDAASKEAALAEVWTALEAAPVAEDTVVREAKLAALLRRLPDSSAAPGSSVAAGALSGLVRRVLRPVVWVPLAAAAAVALFLVLHRPSGDSSVEFIPKNSQNSEQTMISEAYVPKNAEIPEQITLSADNHISTSVPNVKVLHIDTTGVVKNTPIISTTFVKTAPTAKSEEVRSEDPLKTIEEEERHMQIMALQRNTIISIIGTSELFASNKTSMIPMGYSNGHIADNSAATSMIIHHNLPLSIGLSFQCYLNKRIALESGIVYSYLSSTNQQLHYAGIPLNVKYNILQQREMYIYTSVGTTVSYCFAGGGKEHPIQLALTATAGAGYNLFPRISLFGEASFNRYFDDGSPLPTFYGENPYSPGFKAGIRFDIANL